MQEVAAAVAQPRTAVSADSNPVSAASNPLVVAGACVATAAVINAIYPNFSLLLGIAVLDLLKTIMAAYRLVLMAKVYASFFVSLNPYRPPMSIMHKLTQPYLTACRRVIPRIFGLDLSIIVGMRLLSLISSALTKMEGALLQQLI